MNRTRAAMLIGSTLVLLAAGVAAEAKSVKPTRGNDPAGVAIRHADALAGSRIDEWAQVDLGCASRLRKAGTGAGAASSQRCWDETMKAHQALAEEEPEQGVLGPGGRGRGFGLLAPTHRGAGNWKTYPPGIFLSPAVVRPTPGTVPVVTLKTVTSNKSITLTQENGTLVSVPATQVELLVHYPDPFSAPLALAPDQVWWASGMARRYQPVQSVVVRVVVAGGLRRLGYAVDMAVVNESLPGSPQIAATSYGMNATEESLQPPVRGHFVMGSATWWTRELAKDRYAAALAQAELLKDPTERRRRLQAILQVDPTDRVAQGLLGDLEFESFLREGLTKGGISAPDETVRQRLAELFWNFQAQTWRQELTEVSQGHSAAAEAFYGAIRGLEAAGTLENGSPERRRRLGLLYRWNNSVDDALNLHEAGLKQVPSGDRAAQGRYLSDIAWDRIQWLSWNRRYDHPWLTQAQAEATQALEAAGTELDRLTAAEALLMTEALTFTRSPATMEARYQVVKHSHDRLSHVVGLWPHLVGNDLVKALLPEGARVTVPTPTRSEEVTNVEVHARPPRQDIVRRWDFDQDGVDRGPIAFTPVAQQDSAAGTWLVQGHPSAYSPPNVLQHQSPCAVDACYSLLGGETLDFAFPDATVQVLHTEQNPETGAGIVMWERGGPTAYAVVLNPAAKVVKFYRLRGGQADLLGTEAVRLKAGSWHSLRVQRVNYAHVSRPRIAAYVDGFQVAFTPEDVIPMIERVGLVARGKTAVTFDSLHVVDMVTNRPMSAPAAY